MNARRAVALEMARHPVPGRVKTRLALTEGDHEAARIYRILATDVHTALLDAQDAGLVDLALCLPDEDVESPWLDGARHVWAQGDGDLGAKLSTCFRRAFGRGAKTVLAVGTDIVGVDRTAIAHALDALDAADVVAAPTQDGGYGLVGLRADVAERAMPALFDDVPWSTSAVMDTTRARLRAGGLSLVEVPGLGDVDVAADLEGVIPLVSVLVPMWNEAARIDGLLGALTAQADAFHGDVEIVVADGSSSDGSAALARAHDVPVVETARGRGTQLRAAAEVARGRWLWTLHADAGLPDDAVARVHDYCREGPRPWAWCPSRFDHPSPWLRFLECLTDGRARLFRLPYGDQGILVKRALYDAIGGYADVPLMEDVMLARALARYGEPGFASVGLLVDARRWRHHGVLATNARNAATLFRYFVLGADPEKLAAGYVRGE